MTAYERIITALETTGLRVIDTTNGARARCPAHGSRGMSLSITPCETGVLVHCFAGCETGDVLASVRLSTSDLYDNDKPSDLVPLRPRRRRSPSRMPSGEHIGARAAYQALSESERADIARRAEAELVNSATQLAALARVFDAMQPTLHDFANRCAHE